MITRCFQWELRWQETDFSCCWSFFIYQTMYLPRNDERQDMIYTPWILPLSFSPPAQKIQVIAYRLIYTSVEIYHVELHFKWMYLIPTPGKCTIFWIRAKLDIIAISLRRLSSSLKTGSPGAASWTSLYLCFFWPNLHPNCLSSWEQKYIRRERKMFLSFTAQDFRFSSPFFNAERKLKAYM